MADFTVHVTIKDNSKKVLEEFEDKVRLALGAIGETVEGYAKEDCPVDTGLLRNSITYAVGGMPTHIAAYSADRENKQGVIRTGTYTGVEGSTDEKAVYIGTNVEYAQAVEYGSHAHKTGKNHFLRDGATSHLSELSDKAKTILSN